MYKNYIKFLRKESPCLLKLVWRMKITTLLLLITLFQVSASTYGQHSLTMDLKSVTLDQVFRTIKKQTGYNVILVSPNIKSSELVDVKVKKATLNTTISQLIKSKPLDYVIEKNTIVIREKRHMDPPDPADVSTPVTVVSQNMDVRGIVTDENNKVLMGATVRIKGTSRSTKTNISGQFSFSNVDKSAIVEVSYIGYEPRELAAQSDLGRIALQPDDNQLDEVTVNVGMFSRNRQTFTGAEATFSGEELRQVGNLNIVQSLRTLDPSFVVVPNNLQGSNPNQLPQIEMRGKTSISSSGVRDQFSTDPNQPLFILNGMETSLQQIIDLDINRIASVTLLKDAASTALYGSRAANGVLIVETIRPTAGKVRVSYTNSTRLEIPDLADYNMMNAGENLEFQRLAGLYNNNSPQVYVMENLYNQRYKSVLSGVDSYWLNVPLRNSVTQANSLHIDGGSEELQYTVGLNYRKLNGVMKGSDRSTPGASMDLSYRTGKVNITNQFFFNGYVANESPYGTFQDYVNINPYYNKYDSEGNLVTDRYLERYVIPRQGSTPLEVNVPNPLYNASLNSLNKTANTTIQNNLQAIWDISNSWRFSSGLQVQKSSTNVTLFRPSNHTSFDQVDLFRKGRYTNTQREDFNYQTNAMLTYKRTIKERHSFAGNMRGELHEIRFNSLGMAAQGFPENVEPNPAFAYSYLQDAKPPYQISKVRRANLLLSMNYAYDNRIYTDVTYRLDGSTSFGSEKQFSPFWSAGLGWTISREKWFKPVDWLTQLRLRSTYGVTGNQSLGSYASSNVYTYETNISPFGQGIYLSQLGNPNLEWQRTATTNLGVDAVLWANQANVTFNAYHKRSSPLIASGDNPSSSGVSTYFLNVGELNTKGMELNARFSPLYQPERQVVWTLGVMGSLYRSAYSGFGNILKDLNNAAQEENQLQRYLDGYSPDEIWAVTSKGIDPVSGQEVFQRKDGSLSFVYNVADIVPQGQNRPTVEGVLSSNFSYKGFLLGINVRYSVGAKIFNTALFNKVENLTEYDLPFNQDKRALELRWKTPGDIAQFRAINMTAETPISSRFIQRENYFSGESINVGYDFSASTHTWLKKARLSGLRVNAMMNEIFRISTIRSERGTTYPFSRAVSFNVNLYF